MAQEPATAWRATKDSRRGYVHFTYRRTSVYVNHSSVYFLACLDRWLDRLPLPLTADDRRAGFAYRLSILQLELSRTQVFDRPLRGREFFEQVIRDHLDLGRPNRAQLRFDRKIIKTTPGRCSTRVITHGVHPSLHVESKRCHLKQYFKEGRALRTETT